MKAFVWRSGEVDVGDVVPDGTIEIAEGKDADLRASIIAVGRLADEGKTILVPGIPEAANDVEALDALYAFQQEIVARL